MVKTLRWTILSLLLFAGALRADTVQITFTGTSGNVAGGYYIDPYYGTVGGVPNTALWCMDFQHSVRIGDTWTANITPLSGSDLSKTYYGNATKYAMAAYLFSIYSSQPLDKQKEIQWAVWNLFYPNAAPDPYTQSVYDSWWGIAQQHVSEVNLADWRILSDVAGAKQEFIVQQVPEPATLTLLGTGLIGIGALLRRRKRS